MKPGRPKLAAVMIVRNEESLLRVNLDYHRSLGVDEFWVTDNGSTDGTAAALESQAAAHGDVFWSSHPGPYDQGVLVSGQAHRAIDGGATWIIPIDADEFWWPAAGDLRAILATADDVGGLVCSIHNFVQRRSVKVHDDASLLSMTRRAVPVGMPDQARSLVESGSIAFVEMAYPPKHILRSSPDLEIGVGNHTARNTLGALVPCHEISVLHAPLRSMRDLLEREEDGRRVAEAFESETAGWHVRRWARLAEEGQLSEDWTSNSHWCGFLGSIGSGRHLPRDLRLRNAVRPLIDRTTREADDHQHREVPRLRPRTRRLAQSDT